MPIQWNDEIQPKDILQLYSTGNTLYAILSDGLYMLHVKSDGKMIQLTKNILLPDKKLNVILKGKDHILYLCNKNNQLIAYDTQSKKSSLIDCSDWGIHTNDIQNIYVHNGHLFACGQFEGIICYNLKEKHFRVIHISNNQADYKQPNIREICYLKDNRFAISNRRFIYEMKFDGENYLHSNVEIIRRVQYERQFEQLIRNRINKLHYDTDNHVLWIGTYGNGLVRQNVSHTYAFQIKLPENVYHINDIVQDAEGYIWLGTHKHGVLKSTEPELSVQTQFISWKHADSDGSYHLQKDKNGFIWIGGEHGTIQKFNPSTLELKNITPPDSITNVVKDLNVQNLYMNSRNRLWVATTQNVAVYDENTHKWLVFKNYLQPYGKVTCIVEDAEGVMWLGTEHGIYEATVPLDIPNKINMKGGIEEEAGLTANKVLSMHVTNTNQILASYPDKIVRIDKNKIINHIMLQEDIPYGHITCMIDDRNGNTWAGSNESVISIHNKTNTYFSFPLSGNEPTVCRLNDSKLLWANMPELIFFDPVKLKDLPRKKVYITDIEVNARKMAIPNQNIYDAKEIELTQGDHVKFMFSKLNYNTVQNKTTYRLLPTDTIWKENNHNEIVFDHLEAGDYTLEIKPVYPTPGDEAITSLDLVVSQRWFFTPWALVAYSLVIILICNFFFLYARARKKRKRHFVNQHLQLTEELQNEREVNIQQKKEHLLHSSIQASIARDLLTPLSIISNSLKTLDGNKEISPDMQKRFRLAYRNSIYMQEGCDQLSKIHIYQQELLKNQLMVSPCPVYRITESVIRSMRDIISVSPIQVDYGERRNQTILWVDYIKVEFVIRNMLSNAFRRIQYEGNVTCSIDKETIEGVEYCVFRILDDSKAKESVISHHGTLGLSIMKDIAEKHHGNMRIIEKNDGTESLLYIPIGKEHLINAVNVTFTDNLPIEDQDNKPIDLLSTGTQYVDESTSELNVLQKQSNILIVEPHKDTRLFLKQQFENEYTVHAVKKGEEGIEVAHKIMPDLIITEAILPGMNEFELIRSIKEDMEICHIPVILLTALVDNEDIIKGMEYGADDYIRKPFDVEVMRSKIKRIIKSRLELKKSYTQLLVSSANAENEEDPLIAKMYRLIAENVENEDFSVKKLAEMLNMSQTTLYRKVKQVTNFTLIEIVRGARLKRAAELLKSKKYNVQEAAEAVGYNDISTFRKQFVELYGVTPSAYSREERNR